MGLNDVVATVGPGPGGTKQTSIRSYNFWLDSTIQAPGTYAANKHDFLDPDGTNFTSHTIMLINDSGNDIFFSFDGVHDHGRVAANEPLTQDFRREKTIWLRGTAADPFRLWAY